MRLTLECSTLHFEGQLDDESDHLVLAVRASNGKFAGSVVAHVPNALLNRFAEELIAFPVGQGDEARIEIGSEEGWAFLIDRAGHAAMQTALSDCWGVARPARVEFVIPCEVAAINRLGCQIRAWMARPGPPLDWTSTIS